MDDTFTIIQKAHKDAFIDHINSIDSNIHFTYEDPKEDGSIPFLDMLITPDEEGRLNTTVYRKPTHTDQYLHWDSHHAITSKHSVIGTLYHRARTVCSSPNQLAERRETPVQIPEKMQVPKLGIKQSEAKEPNISPEEKQRKQQQTSSKQQQRAKNTYCGSLPSRAEWELQKNLQKLWDWSTSERRSYHQRPSYGPQG